MTQLHDGRKISDNYYYRMAGNFRRVQFSRMVNLYNFADVCTHAHYVLYNRAYFTDLIFTVRGIICENWTIRKFPAVR